MRKTMLLVGAMAMMAASLFGQARQEEKASYPSGPITMIIPYGAGGTADVSGRQFAALLSK